MENRFKVGDLVWAKVHQYPWWPGLIYHETLASIEAREAKKESCLLVSFFGDHSYKWLDPNNLLPFESNFNVYSKRYSSRLFMKAVDEAVYEVKHRAALGLTCPCKKFASYQRAPVEGFLEVDLDGYKSGGVFTVEQIEQCRQEFVPVETLPFLYQLALDPKKVGEDLIHSKETTRMLAFRKARYQEVDEPYFEAFGVDLMTLRDPIVASNCQETALIQDATGQVSKAKTQGQKTAEVKCQTEKKRCLAAQKHKPSDGFQKRRQPKAKVENKLDFTSASDYKKESSSSLHREPSTPKDHEELKSVATTTNCDDMQLVEEIDCSGSVMHNVLFVEKVQSSETSKTQKWQESVCSADGGNMPLGLSPQRKRRKEDNNRITEAAQEGPKRILLIYFPPDAALPSASDLKSEFSRFGPIESLSVHVSEAKSWCEVVFVNESDAKKAYNAVDSRKMLGQTKVTYKLHAKVSKPDLFESGILGDNNMQQDPHASPLLLEGGISGANANNNPQEEETCITHPYAHLCRISQEIHTRYWEQMDRTPLMFNQGNVDISQKFLFLLNQCHHLVGDLAGSWRQV